MQAVAKSLHRPEGVGLPQPPAAPLRQTASTPAVAAASLAAIAATLPHHQAAPHVSRRAA